MNNDVDSSDDDESVKLPVPKQKRAKLGPRILESDDDDDDDDAFAADADAFAADAAADDADADVDADDDSSNEEWTELEEEYSYITKRTTQALTSEEEEQEKLVRVLSKYEFLRAEGKDPQSTFVQAFCDTTNDDFGFPSALTRYTFSPFTLNEKEILMIEREIRDKPEWWNKIMNEEIFQKWRTELEEWTDDTCMIDYVLNKCTWQADFYRAGPVRPTGCIGVFCRNDLSGELLRELLAGVAKLRSLPAIGSSKEDRHPGTPQMVDLVHPSLYAYEEEKTHVLEQVGAEATQMPEWSSFILHSTVPGPPLPSDKGVWCEYKDLCSIGGLQWLPAEFQVTQDATSCQIRSYINNLHPIEYSDMYESIGKLFCHAVPVLEQVLTESKVGLDVGAVFPAPHDEDESDGDDGDDDDDDDGDDDDDDDDDDDGNSVQRPSREFVEPKVKPFDKQAAQEKAEQRERVSLRERPLQVIVKIASLELGPGKHLDAGSWHVEGTASERIVATACCYLENLNINSSSLEFRVGIDKPDAHQEEEEGRAIAMYGLGFGDPLVQDIGYCTTTPGLILAWPNTLQHQVSKIELEDEEKPGKRTICCFFLVDPTVRIRSTATVPPQQKAWAKDCIASITAAVEGSIMEVDVIRHRVMELYDSLPHSPPFIGYEVACERRKRLMDERREALESYDEDGSSFYQRTFSMCEH